MILGRGATVHIPVFVPKIFGSGLTVLYASVPNKYSVVLTTARVELHWRLPVLHIDTFDKKQRLIFQIMSIFQEM